MVTMRKRFVPTHYYKDIYNKFETLSQDSKSVDKYFKEMKVAMIKANIFQDKEAKMARFFNGLNKDIPNVMELQHYIKIEDMVHMAVKVDKQLTRKGSAKPSGYLGSSLGWKSNFRRRGNAEVKPMTTPNEVKPFFVKKQVMALEEKEKNIIQPKHKRDIRCFRC